MKILRYPLIMVCLLLFNTVSAQSGIAALYDKATKWNCEREYVKAAKAFKEVQDMAFAQEAYEWCVPAVTAEGECYYMLNILTAMEQSLNRAKQFYSQYSTTVSKDSVRWIWGQSLSKLEGSYYSCLMDVSPYNYSNAEKAYQKSFSYLDSLKNDLSISFDDEEASVILHRELLSLYFKNSLYQYNEESRQRSYQKALNEAEKYIDHYRDMDIEVSPTTPEEKQAKSAFIDAYVSYAMVLARLKRFGEAQENLSLMSEFFGNEPTILRAKGKVLMLQYDAGGDGGENLQEKAADYYKQYIDVQRMNLKKQMDLMTDSQREQFWLNMHDFLYDCCRMADYDPGLVYDLMLYCKAYLLEYDDQKAKAYTWKDVQKRLKPQECAIEFMLYYGKGDVKYLGALVLTRECEEPLFVEIAPVEKLTRMYLKGGMSLGQALMSLQSTDKNQIYNDPDLPRKIWTDSLMRKIGTANKIYFAADGLLHQLAIEYLMPDSNRTCRRLTSTRQLMNPPKPLNKRKMLLFGGVRYDVQLPEQGQGNDAQAYMYLKPLQDVLIYLPGTLSEIDSVMDIRGEVQDVKVEGAEATDSAFLAMVNHYPIVHISTHGFFCAEKKEDIGLVKTWIEDNSMSQSALAFSGAKYALTDSTFNTSSPDGLISAKELATIRMDSVELMVLSACQTGLGYITADGVYGIQRALKQAGVKALIVSLWSVNDEATSILMKNFYRNLKNAPNADVYEAFMKARQQLKTEGTGSVLKSSGMTHEDVDEYDAPQYSDAFILIDVQ